MTLDRQLETAIHAARAGGQSLMESFGKAQRVEQKSVYNLVSEADLKSEQRVADAIRSDFPAHAILGEESNRGDMNAEHLWIIDPLDGTNNFVHRIPHFAVSVAYYHQGRPTVGVVYQPVTDTLYTAAVDGGAAVNGKPASVDAAESLNQSLIGVGFYYDRGEQMRMTLRAIEQLFACDIHGIRRMGTASLDLCMVGTGLLGAYFEFELAPWDYAAGRLFVEQAGGQVTDCLGDPLPLGNTSVLASNRKLHPPMLAVVSDCFQRFRSKQLAKHES